MTKPPHHDAPACVQCAGPLVSPDGSGVHPTAATAPRHDETTEENDRCALN